MNYLFYNLMRLIALTPCLIAGQVAFGAALKATELPTDMCYGKLERAPSGILYFIPEAKKEVSYRITNTEDDVTSILDRLNSEDQIYGVGAKDDENSLIHFESIERIGLHNLLGRWWTDDGNIIFENYTRVSVYPSADQDVPTSPCPEITKARLTFQYSLIPSNEKKWVMFLSSCSFNYYSNLEILDDRAVIYIYDSKSGEKLRTIFLIRMPIPNFDLFPQKTVDTTSLVRRQK